MIRILKILAIIFGVVIGLFLLLVVAVTLLVDPNDYKETIASQAKSATGRDVAIEGDIKLSTFPWFALDLGRVTVGNAAGFEEPVFASIDKTEISLSLIPLISGSVETNVLRLDGLNVKLTRKPDGSTNWEDLAGGGSSETEQPPTAPEDAPTEPTGDTEPAKPLALNIGGVEITNATLVWDDQQANSRYTVSNANLTTGAITRAQQFDLVLGADIAASGAQNLTANVALNAAITADLEAQSAQIDALKFDVQAAGDIIPGGEQRVALASEHLAVQWVQGDIVVKGFVLEAMGANIKLDVDGKQTLTEESVVKIALGAEPFNLRETLVQLQMADVLPSDKLLNKVGFNFQLDGKIRDIVKLALNVTVDDAKLALPNAVFNHHEQTLDTGDLTLTGMGLDLKTKLLVNQVLTNPQLDGTIQLNPLDLKALMANLGLPAITTTDDAALRKIGLSTKVAGNMNQVALSDFQFTLDDTSLAGEASVAEFQKPVVRFNLNVDALNADRYLPPPSEVEAPPPPPTQEEAEAQGLDTLLKNLDLEGNFQVNSLQVSGLKVTDIVMAARSKNGRLSVTPKLQLYEGGMDGNIGIDVNGEKPVLSIKNTLQGIQAGPLLDDLQNGSGQLSGTGNLAIDLTADMSNADALMKTLNGVIQFSFVDGAIKGFNLAHSIRQAKAMFSGGTDASAQAEPGPLKTDFSELRGTFQAGEGNLQGRELLMKAPFLRVDGTGVVSLIEQTLDYRLNVSVVETSKGQGGEALQDLVGLTIPVQIDGTATAPKVGVALGDLLKAQARNKAKEKVGELLLKKLAGDEAQEDGAANAEQQGGDPAKQIIDSLGDLFK